MAAVTNLSHKPGGLTEQQFILSQFWRQNFQNQEFKVNKGGVASKTWGNNTFLASVIFWWLLAFLGLWPRYPALCLGNPFAFPSSICTFPLLLFSRFSHVQLFATPWTVACQAPLSMGFPRQEYWSGLPFPFQRIFLTQGWNLHLLHWQVGESPKSPSAILLKGQLWWYLGPMQQSKLMSSQDP